MVYEFDIKVLTTNTIDNPKVVDLKLTAGIIHRYEVYFPPGCNNLVRVGINRGLHQIWPTNPEGRHKGDGATLSYREHYDLVHGPHLITIRAYSIGCRYDHIITVRFAMLTSKILAPWLLTWAEKLGLYGGGE